MAETEEKDKKFLWFIRIRSDISPLNFCGFIVTVLFSITFFVFLNSSTSFVISVLLGITNNIGQYSGDLTFYDEILTLFLALFWGSLSDRIGRRPVAVASYLLIGLSMFVFTLAKNVYPDLLLCRLVFAAGASGASTMITALTGDYTGRNRGTMSAIAGLVAGIGALIGVFGLLPMPATLQSRYGSLEQAVRVSFYATGAIAFGVAILAFLLLKNEKDRSLIKWMRGENRELVKESYFKLIGRGFLSAKQDTRIMLAYIGGFVARADSIMASLFITLIINQYFISNKLCQVGVSSAYADTAAIRSSCRDAYTTSSIISGISSVFALIGAPLFGFLADRIPRTIALSVACVCGVVAFFGMGLIPDPRSKIAYFFSAMIGIAQIGTIVTSLALVSEDYVSPEIRGSVSGTYTLMGGIGILVISKLGGHLFDSWTPGAPFIIMGIMHAIVAIFGFIVEIISRKRKGHQLDASPNEDGLQKDTDI
ncbi:uncharacterized protein VTP21DRAFT_516 [Calcarisporiella thermophila]|uniref:uncharacterized protein n=1 Tax=Calcarisporiella thermophila TaxID=911321 RepID=UPI003743D66D